MTMAWYSDNESLSDNAASGASFQRHDARMRRFRRTHPDLNAPWVAATEKEDCFNLLPLRKVNPTRLSSN
ncbi:hypothetical protein ACFLV1_02140 [Chloroflexota bacterium]